MLQALKDWLGLVRLALKTPEPKPDIEGLGDVSVWPQDPLSNPRYLIDDDGDDYLLRAIEYDREHRKKYGRDPE